MNRYDHQFRALPAHLRSTPVQRVGYASGALFAHRANGLGWEDDDAIVRQFDLSGMDEFWEIKLSEPMTCTEFIRALAGHFYKLEWRPGLSEEECKKLGPAADRVNDSVKIGIRQALRAARSYGEPWFMVIAEPPPSNKLDHRAALRRLPGAPTFVQPEPPADGINLNKLRVRPREAALWMLGNATRRHLVPPSLAAAMAPKVVERPPASVVACMPEAETPRSAPKRVQLATASPVRKRGPRPKVGPRVEAEMRSAMRQGEDLAAMSQFEMHVRFKASESLCRDIREAILDQNASDLNSA